MYDVETNVDIQAMFISHVGHFFTFLNRLNHMYGNRKKVDFFFTIVKHLMIFSNSLNTCLIC